MIPQPPIRVRTKIKVMVAGMTVLEFTVIIKEKKGKSSQPGLGVG